MSNLDDYESIKEHWNRCARSARDAREQAIDALPDFPGVLPVPCPMCKADVNMPEYLRPGVYEIHSSDPFPVRRSGSMRFTCRVCGYLWHTKTANDTGDSQRGSDED